VTALELKSASERQGVSNKMWHCLKFSSIWVTWKKRLDFCSK